MSASTTPTLSPIILTWPGFAPCSWETTLRCPDTMAVAVSSGISRLFSVNLAFPALSTFIPVSTSWAFPVNNSGRSVALMGKMFPAPSLGGSISKLRMLPGLEIVTLLLPGTAAMRISPPGAVTVPVFITCPATREISFPWLTPKSPALIIAPGWEVSKANWLGFPTKFW